MDDCADISAVRCDAVRWAQNPVNAVHQWNDHFVSLQGYVLLNDALLKMLTHPHHGKAWHATSPAKKMANSALNSERVALEEVKSCGWFRYHSLAKELHHMQWDKKPGWFPTLNEYPSQGSVLSIELACQMSVFCYMAWWSWTWTEVQKTKASSCSRKTPIRPAK